MSYSNINDAFNINSHFENTIRGMNSFNPVASTMENIRSGYNTNLNRNSNENHSPVPLIDGMFMNDNSSWESLNGTDLLSASQYEAPSNTDTIKHDQNSSSSQRKLTHRECINIYSNPDSYKDNILTCALKHVSKCKLCKDEIKNNTEHDEKRNQTKNSNTHISSIESKQMHQNIPNTNNFDNSNNSNNSNNFNASNAKLESELKFLNEKINEETNFKYQNAMLQNNLSKYLEDLEEKKKINNKLDKIMEIVNLSLSKTDAQTNLIGTTLTPMAHFLSQNQNQIQNQIQNQAQGNIWGEQNLYNALPPQILNNLAKLTQVNSSNSSNNNDTSYILYFGICVVVILLIVDIILRFSLRSN